MLLDNLSQIKNLDKGKMLESIEALAEQCRQAWQDLKGYKLPRSYRQIQNIVVAGMGGSAIGAHVIDSVYANALTVPLEIVNDYHLPAYVGKETLVILSSYSGSTEEAVSCAAEAEKRGAKLLVITSGKHLADLMSKKSIPGYLFEPRYNPCGSPRMGLGYSLFGLLILFDKLGLIKFGEAEARQAVRIIEKHANVLGVKTTLAKNPAKQLAEKLVGKMPMYFAAPPLAGSIHTAANQLNENAKVFAAWFLLPEANHHLMEGLVFPKGSQEKLAFVFFEGANEEERIKRRFQLTREVAGKSGITAISYSLRENSRLGQVFEMLVLGSYTSFYLAILYGIDPTSIPVVDWFKKRML